MELHNQTCIISGFRHGDSNIGDLLWFYAA